MLSRNCQSVASMWFQFDLGSSLYCNFSIVCFQVMMMEAAAAQNSAQTGTQATEAGGDAAEDPETGGDVAGEDPESDEDQAHDEVLEDES